MTEYRVFRFSRVLGNVAFWGLILAMLFAGGLTWLTVVDPPTLGSAPYSGAANGYEQFRGDVTYGDTLSNNVVTAVDTRDAPSSLPSFSQVSLVCAILFVAAGWAEARVLGPHRLRFVTAAVPVVVIGILWLATPGAVSDVVLDPWWAFVLVAVAVAVREVWFRRYAPQLQRPDPAAPETS